MSWRFPKRAVRPCGEEEGMAPTDARLVAEAGGKGYPAVQQGASAANRALRIGVCCSPVSINVRSG